MLSLRKQHHWSHKDILNLLECIQNNIPLDDTRAFKKTQEEIDWDKVAFKQFSGEICKQKWIQISHKLRKLRTLSELVLEANEHIIQSSKNNKHPYFPKRPLTAYMCFYKENQAKYSQLYPKHNNQQLAKILAEKYNELPREIKEKYIQDVQRKNKDFQENLTQFTKNFNGVEHYKNSVVPRGCEVKVPKKSQEDMENVKSPPDKESPKTFSSMKTFQGEPKKPPMNGYQKFHQDLWSSPELHHLPFRERWVEISRRWHRVPKSMKDQYSCQAEELQKQYWVELDHWLKGLSPEEYATYKEAKASCGKRSNFTMSGGRSPKSERIDQQSTSSKELQEGSGEMQRLLPPATDSLETIQSHTGGSQAVRQNMMEDCEEDDPSSSSDEDDEYCP
ncbi:upstream-binding factor 1 1 [Sigmodon hispidus]